MRSTVGKKAWCSRGSPSAPAPIPPPLQGPPLLASALSPLLPSPPPLPLASAAPVPVLRLPPLLTSAALVRPTLTPPPLLTSAALVPVLLPTLTPPHRSSPVQHRILSDDLGVVQQAQDVTEDLEQAVVLIAVHLTGMG